MAREANLAPFQWFINMSVEYFEMFKIKIENLQRVSWYRNIIILLSIIVISVSFVSCSVKTYNSSLRIESIPDSISCNSSALNYWQFESQYLLHVYDNYLYYYECGSTVIGFCTDKTVLPVVTLAKRINGERINGLCFVDDLFYFRYYFEDKCHVSAIDIITQEIFDIGIYSVFGCAPFDNFFYSPIDQKTYLKIDSKGATIQKNEHDYIETYAIDNAQIIKTFSNNIRYGTLNNIDSQGNITTVIENFDYEEYCLYQLDDGRIIVYDFGKVGRKSDVLVWIIDNQGTVLPLFSGVTGEMVESSANVCGDKLYISFIRYEKWKTLYSLKFNDDKLSGTWVIDLETYESTKLSDSFYEGLFVFGDELIFIDSTNSLVWEKHRIAVFQQ